ncbi:MAG: rRNA (guanine527-N7)-methyltransferase [Solirubrobacterales bacterium]|nr:rRNA (guanine527-N7)-methyltransferase [Solirubrobacterales bacterium]
MTDETELRRRLEPVLDLLAADPASLSSIRGPGAWKAHVEDSLSGLELVGAPDRLADVGSGAGFPGLALAAALPATQVDLIESVGRKVAFIERAIAAAELDNARVIHARSEEWALDPEPDGGREAYDLVTARAVGRLATLAELASPLLRDGGALVAWKGRRDPEEEAELGRAGERLAMAPERTVEAGDRAGSPNRHLYLVRKAGATPPALPRRPGIAKKRPLGRG